MADRRQPTDADRRGPERVDDGRPGEPGKSAAVRKAIRSELAGDVTDDATAIREGGAAATLKGIQFNSFGAFFSRAYRENDYLWGRLHGADRLIEITVSSLPEGMHLPPGLTATLKRDIFRAILAEEKERLTTVQPLFEELEREVG